VERQIEIGRCWTAVQLRLIREVVTEELILVEQVNLGPVAVDRASDQSNKMGTSVCVHTCTVLVPTSGGGELMYDTIPWLSCWTLATKPFLVDEAMPEADRA
jgi:hypothetical protein